MHQPPISFSPSPLNMFVPFFEQKAQPIQKELTLCAKHKSHPIAICVNLACKKPRLACNKCGQDHRSHHEHLISIDYILGKTESSLPQIQSRTFPLPTLQQPHMLASMHNQHQQQQPAKDSSNESCSFNNLNNIQHPQAPKYSQTSPIDIDQNQTIFCIPYEKPAYSSTTPNNHASINDDLCFKQVLKPDNIESDNHHLLNAIRSSLIPPNYYINPLVPQSLPRSAQGPSPATSTSASTTPNYPFYQSQIPSNMFAPQSDSHSRFPSQQTNAPPQMVLNRNGSKEKVEEQEQQGLPAFLFKEVVSQDSNLSKIYGFLQNLEHVKSSLTERINAIRCKLLTQLGLQTQDFSYNIVSVALTSNFQVEDKLRNYFQKLSNLNTQLKTHVVEFNTQYQIRLTQIEEELDRLLTTSIVSQQANNLGQCQFDDENRVTVVPENEFEELWEYYRANPSQDIQGSKKQINTNNRYVIEFDGVAKGNPGRASAGFLIRECDDETMIVLEHSLQIGSKTVNQAEYLSLVYAMHVSHELGIRHLVIHSDSEVIVKQMQKIHQVRSPLLKDYHLLANYMLPYFYSIHFVQIPKQLNIRADSLAAQAL